MSAPSSPTTDNNGAVKRKSITKPQIPCDMTSNDAEKKDAVPVKPVWVEDQWSPSCSGCGVEFGLLKRRHHCRGCGKVFCHQCSNYWLLPPENFAYKDPQRNCETCFKKLSIIDFDTDFDTYGSPQNKAIILLHGATESRKHWVPQIEYLKNTYYLLIPDLPGHGSRVKEQPLVLNSCVEILQDLVLNHVPTQKALIIGHDLGGFIGMGFAGTHPELVEGLICLNSCIDASKIEKTLQWRSLLYKGMTNKMKASYSYGSAPIPQQIKNQYLRTGSFYDSWNSVCSLLSTNDWVSLLKNYPGQVLFINSEKEVRDGEKLYYAAAAKGKVEVIEGANYLMMVDERFSKKVNNFIGTFAEALEWKPLGEFYNPVPKSPSVLGGSLRGSPQIEKPGKGRGRGIRKSGEGNKSPTMAKPKPKGKFKSKVDVTGTRSKDGLWDSIMSTESKVVENSGATPASGADVNTEQGSVASVEGTPDVQHGVQANMNAQNLGGEQQIQQEVEYEEGEEEEEEEEYEEEIDEEEARRQEQQKLNQALLLNQRFTSYTSFGLPRNATENLYPNNNNNYATASATHHPAEVPVTTYTQQQEVEYEEGEEEEEEEYEEEQQVQGQGQYTNYYASQNYGNTGYTNPYSSNNMPMNFGGSMNRGFMPNNFNSNNTYQVAGAEDQAVEEEVSEEEYEVSTESNYGGENRYAVPTTSTLDNNPYGKYGVATFTN